MVPNYGVVVKGEVLLFACLNKQAHTLLWYDRYGADVFRRLAGTRRKPAQPRPGKRRLPPRRDLEQVWQRARENEAEIWRILVTEKRTVTREAYRRLAEAFPSVSLTTSRK
jgi:hypothetical protein